MKRWISDEGGVMTTLQAHRLRLSHHYHHHLNATPQSRQVLLHLLQTTFSGQTASDREKQLLAPEAKFNVEIVVWMLVWYRE